MYRIVFIAFTVLLAGCRPARMDNSFSDLRATAQVLEGSLVVKSSKQIKDCVGYSRTRILDKLLYQGFENTAVWRPQELKKELITEDMRQRLGQNIYITGVRQGERGRQCHCQFQVNLASIRKQLEHEGVIPAFGY